VPGGGTTDVNMTTFVYSLTGSQRTELAGRCGVIADPSNASRYDQKAQDFCRSYMTVASSTNFGAAANGGTTAAPNVSGGGGGSPGPVGNGSSTATGAGTGAGAAR
jgi:hypothetical protein